MADRIKFSKSQGILFAEIRDYLVETGVAEDSEWVVLMNLKHEQAVKPRERKEDEQVAEFRADVLAWLEDAGVPVTMKDATEVFGATPQKMGRYLNDLAKSGYAVITFNENGDKQWTAANVAE